MIRINLLPIRAEKKRETLRRQLSVAGLSVVLLSLILWGIYFSATNKIAQLNNSIAAEENKSAQLDKEIGELKNIENERKVVLEKLNIVKQLDVNRKWHLKMFSDITGAMPEKVWIDSLKETGQTVAITGFAASDDVVADFMRSLEKTLAGWKVELEVVSQVLRENQKLAGFTIRLERPK